MSIETVEVVDAEIVDGEIEDRDFGVCDLALDQLPLVISNYKKQAAMALATGKPDLAAYIERQIIPALEFALIQVRMKRRTLASPQ